MKKKMLGIFVCMLLIAAAVPVINVVSEPLDSTFELSANVMVAKEHLAKPLITTGENGEGGSSLPEVIPFWVDLVDAESQDVDYEGEGVYIAVLDTGLLSNWADYLPEANIADELGIGYTHDVWWDDDLGDFVMGPLRDDRGIITKAFEGSGHGTHVTSTIVGFKYDHPLDPVKAWVRGVAPKATIIPVLVLDAWLIEVPWGWEFFRGGTWEMISAGINYIADLSDELDGPVIISMSLGGYEPSEILEDAVDYAISKGVIVVAAAGNEGYDGMRWPGAYNQVISCAAGGWTEMFTPCDPPWWDPYWTLNDVPENLKTVDYWGNEWHIYLEDFSSRPNEELGQDCKVLDVTCPGAAIVGPFKEFLNPTWDYYYVWGTSMATPHVSAIASMVLECALENEDNINQKDMENIVKDAAGELSMKTGGAWAYEPFWYELFYYEWYKNDWGKGFLQADTALEQV